MADRTKKRAAGKKPVAGKRAAKRPPDEKNLSVKFRPRGFLGLAWIQFRAVRWPSV